MATPTIPAPVNVFCSATQMRITLAPGVEFADDDPVVKEFKWAFAPQVEDASANPGSKRSVRRVSAQPS